MLISITLIIKQKVTPLSLPVGTSLPIRQNQQLVSILGSLAALGSNAVQRWHQTLHSIINWVCDVHHMGLPATVFGGFDHLK